MASSTDICNLALGWIGDATITSLDDPSKAARLCKLNYPLTFAAVLESRWWTFASERRLLSRDPVGPAWGSESRYSIPADAARVLKVLEVDTWAVEAGYILTPDTTADLKVYVLKSTVDLAEVSPTFVQALAARLAAVLAIPLAENRALQESMWALYGSLIKEAVFLDNSQGTAGRISNSMSLQR